MPLYEYECRKCKAHIEILQKIGDKPLTKCRQCGGRLEKQWSQSGFQFKGSGWYVTDYAGKKTGGKEERASGASEAKSQKSETKESTTTEKEAAPAKKAAEKKNASSNTPSGD
jgi:putative FmdB family regulatory protein